MTLQVFFKNPISFLKKDYAKILLPPKRQHRKRLTHIATEEIIQQFGENRKKHGRFKLNYLLLILKK